MLFRAREKTPRFTPAKVRAVTTHTTPEQALDGVELIKPGPATAMSGARFDFTTAILADLAASYDPALHEAPHVKGHPSTDGPALGWVQAVSINAAGRLQLDASRQVDATFADDVRAGRWKKRSLSLYMPEADNNPTPGHWNIKHVGWLGAMAPAIKGLRDAPAFADPEPGVLSFGDWDDELNAGLWRRMREWLIAQFGTDAADKVVPAYEVDALQREALREEPLDDPQPTRTAFADESPPVTTAATTVTSQSLVAQAAALDARAAALTAQEAAAATLQASARNAGLAAFADAMVQEGRLLPRDLPGVLGAMQAVPDTCTVVSFAEGDPTKPTTSPAVEAFKAFIKSLPPRVEFAELAGRSQAAATVDLGDYQAIGRAAQEFITLEAAAGRTVRIEAAVAHVQATNKSDA